MKVDKNHRHGEAPLGRLSDPNIHPVDWVVYEVIAIGKVTAKAAFDAKAEALIKYGGVREIGLRSKESPQWLPAQGASQSSSSVAEALEDMRNGTHQINVTHERRVVKCSKPIRHMTKALRDTRRGKRKLQKNSMYGVIGKPVTRVFFKTHLPLKEEL